MTEAGDGGPQPRANTKIPGRGEGEHLGRWRLGVLRRSQRPRGLEGQVRRACLDEENVELRGAAGGQAIFKVASINIGESLSTGESPNYRALIRAPSGTYAYTASLQIPVRAGGGAWPWSLRRAWQHAGELVLLFCSHRWKRCHKWKLRRPTSIRAICAIGLVFADAQVCPSSSILFPVISLSFFVAGT